MLSSVFLPESGTLQPGADPTRKIVGRGPAAHDHDPKASSPHASPSLESGAAMPKTISGPFDPAKAKESHTGEGFYNYREK